MLLYDRVSIRLQRVYPVESFKYLIGTLYKGVYQYLVK